MVQYMLFGSRTGTKTSSTNELVSRETRSIEEHYIHFRTGRDEYVYGIGGKVRICFSELT
jgi:hypothetical protein